LIDIAFIIAFFLQGAIWVRELILGLIGRKVAEENGSGALGNAMAIIRVLVSVALFTIAGILILDNLGVNVTALVAGLGIGGIAIGLAAQGIFSDLFAALAIVFDRPFRRGDTVTYGTTTGTVERIGLKTTRLRGRTGEQVIMANTKLVFLPFALTYQTPPETLERLAEIVAEAVEPLKTAKLVRCVPIQFGLSSIDCELVYDDRTINPDKLSEHKADVIIGVMRIFAREKIQFAYPTQTTFTAAPDGTLVMPWAPPAEPK
jgi:small-conductance mechanosensitive channel